MREVERNNLQKLATLVTQRNYFSIVFVIISCMNVRKALWWFTASISKTFLSGTLKTTQRNKYEEIIVLINFTDSLFLLFVWM